MVVELGVFYEKCMFVMIVVASIILHLIPNNNNNTCLSVIWIIRGYKVDIVIPAMH